MHRYRDIRPLKLPWPWNPGQESQRPSRVSPRSGESEMSVLQTPVCRLTFRSAVLPVAVAVSAWRHVQHSVHMVLWQCHRWPPDKLGNIVDCDWDVEATGCDRGTAFAAALLRARRSRKRRGVGADAATDTSARLSCVVASSSISVSDVPSTTPNCAGERGGKTSCGGNIRRRNARRRFKSGGELNRRPFARRPISSGYFVGGDFKIGELRCSQPNLFRPMTMVFNFLAH